MADNNEVQQNRDDRLFKLRPLITQLNRQYQNLYVPSQVQSIDEAMILFKGHSSIKQYNPMNPIKRGYKIWCRAGISGYINQFDVYQGKSSNVTGDATESFGLGGKVIANLSKSLQHKNHVLDFDNYFSSVPLLHCLLEKGIYACCTVRPDRKLLPKLKADKELKCGDFDWRVSDSGIVFIKKGSAHAIDSTWNRNNTSCQKSERWQQHSSSST